MTNKQTILITGATGSIGGGAAIALAKRGARVVLLNEAHCLFVKVNQEEYL